MYPHQTDRLNQVLERESLEALVATAPENIAYVTGFRSLSQAIYRRTPLFAIFTRRGSALVVPVIEAPAVADAAVDVEHVITYGEFHLDLESATGDAARRVREWSASPRSNAADALAAALDALGVRSGPVGLDDTSLAFDAWHRASQRLASLHVRAAGSDFTEARMVKGPYEIECLERALHVLEDGANAVIQALEPGMAERDAVRLHEKTVTEKGALPYISIVAFAERGAIPAAYASDRLLRMGDLVRLEIGCVFRGYCAALARTAVMGQPSEPQEHAYEAVHAGLEAALRSMKPGATAGHVYDAAVTTTRDGGLSGYRRHHVGHGIGLDPFEPPLLASGDDTELEEGMVLRVETPYYRIGWGAVTVMDTVLVTRGGCRGMNRSARGLISLD